MCGLAGVFSYADDAPPVDGDELGRMQEHMVARGPDDAGLWVSPDRRLGLAHRRLAIIDLTSDGAQPMASADGRYQIVFNGEIYNYRILREQLKRRGAAFRSRSDTEVLLQLYAAEGPAMCRQLRGMYAFAIWDGLDQSVFLARDCFGIKPLYVHDNGRTLRFASQVRAMIAGGATAGRPEPAGHVGYWIWGHIPEPWTLHSGVMSLPPGTWFRVDRSGRRSRGEIESVSGMLRSGAEGQDSRLEVDSGESGTSLREALLDTVRDHLVADVPVGIFLSSGIDSATLASVAAECGGRLNTVTLGFEEYRGTKDDETVLAEEVARRCGADHHTLWVRRAEFDDSIGDFLDAMDQPSTDGLNTWLVSRAAAQLGLKVAISGLGGDELFAGYPSFSQVPAIRRIARPASLAPGLGALVRKLSSPILGKFTSEKYAGMLEYGATWEGAYMLRRATRMPWELGRVGCLDPETIAAGLERLSSTRKDDSWFAALGRTHNIVTYLEATRYMRDRLLRDADWAGMAHSVEIRVPLVDTRFARHVARHNAGGEPYRKSDLANCARPGLPDELWTRPKTGFTVPVREWLQGKPGAIPGERGLRTWQAVVAKAFTG